MNSKNIIPLDDDLCLVCQKNKATHTYDIYGRGYGSIFDSDAITFKCCDECNKAEYPKWFGEEIQYSCPEEYLYEDHIWELFKSLPINSQEKIFNVSDYVMEPQDWIDYELDELPHEKCKEYGRYSPQEIKAYQDRFPVCDKVFKKVYSDGSSGCWCERGANGDSDGSCDGNISDECYMCTSFEVKHEPMKTINIAEEELQRENERLIEMLVYASEHLKEKNIDISQYIKK